MEDDEHPRLLPAPRAELEFVDDMFDNPNVEQDEPRLVKYIRKNHLTPPPLVRNRDRIYEPSEWAKELRAIFGGKVYLLYTLEYLLHTLESL